MSVKNNMPVIHADSLNGFLVLKSCNVSSGFSKYFRSVILRTVNEWGKFFGGSPI